jgi:hypothetical protein
MSKRKLYGEPEELATVEQVEEVQPKPEVPKPKAEAKTPREWAAKLGHIVKARTGIPQTFEHASMAHAVADKLHGWSAHEHHYQSTPLMITQADYEAALKAGGEYPVTPAHEPALSPVKRPKEKR